MSRKLGIVVIGAGPYTKLAVSTLAATGRRVAGIYDDDPQKWGAEVLGIPVVGPISELVPERCSQALIGIGDNEARKRFAEQLNLEWTVAVHPTAWVHPGVKLGPGTVVCAGAVVQPDAEIGSHVILNTKASVGCDCKVASYARMEVAHLGENAVLGEGGFLDIGSCVLPHIQVGAWARVGAGSLVVRDIPPGDRVENDMPGNSVVEKRANAVRI